MGSFYCLLVALLWYREIKWRDLPRVLINENNKLFFNGCYKAGYKAEQFPLNLRGCRGSSLCNLGCPNAAKMATNRVQLPDAERAGVEVVTRAEVVRLEDHAAIVTVHDKPPGAKGRPSTWAPGRCEVFSPMPASRCRTSSISVA